jgi:hypothetical protein
MTDEKTFEVDLDREAIQLDGQWHTRKELADRIKRMIESQDFRISVFGSALEYLENAIASARRFDFALLGPDAARLAHHAEQSGLKVETFVRQAVLAYLAAQPRQEPGLEAPTAKPLPKAAPGLTPIPPVVTTITTEPANPSEVGEAVELTARKSTETSKVVIDPSYPQPADQEVVSDGWFKKS